MVIELDYAYLADYATVADGKLSAIGASFTHAKVAPGVESMNLSLAGRFRAPEDTTGARVQVEVQGPGDRFNVKADAVIEVTNPGRPYGGKIGILFAFNLTIPVVGTGLYVVTLYLEGEQVRRLAFDIEA